MGDRITERWWWRWRGGMLTIGGLRVDGVSEDGRPVRREGAAEVYGPRETEQPDLTDPATLGCLTQRARELWGRPDLCTCTLGGRGSGCWGVICIGMPDPLLDVDGPTEAAALVAACDAAPRGGA